MKLHLPIMLRKMVVLLPLLAASTIYADSVLLEAGTTTILDSLTVNAGEKVGNATFSEGLESGSLTVGTLTVNGTGRVMIEGHSNDGKLHYGRIDADTIIVNGSYTSPSDIQTNPNVQIALGTIGTLNVQKGTVVLNKDLTWRNSVSDAKHIIIEDKIEQSGGTLRFGWNQYPCNGAIATWEGIEINQTGGTLESWSKIFAKDGLNINQSGGEINLEEELILYSGGGSYTIAQSGSGTMNVTLATHWSSLTKGVEVTQSGSGTINLTAGTTFKSSGTGLIKQDATEKGTINLSGNFSKSPMDIEQSGTGSINIASAAKVSAAKVTCGSKISVTDGGSFTITDALMMEKGGQLSGTTTIAQGGGLGFTPGVSPAATSSQYATLTWESGNPFIKLLSGGNITTGTEYVLLSDKPTWWTDDMTHQVGGISFDASTVYWNDADQLVYKRSADVAPLTQATWNGYESNRWNTTELNWQQGTDGHTYADGVDVVFGDAGAGTVELEGALEPGKVTVNNSTGNDYVWTGTGGISGATSLTKQGAGKLTLKNSNSHTGGTVVEGGTLVVSAVGALAENADGTPADIVLKGGTLQMAASVNLGGSTPDKITAEAGAASILTVDSRKTVTLSSPIINKGDLTLSGSGTLMFDNVQILDETHVDTAGVQNNAGYGFVRDAGRSVQVVDMQGDAAKLSSTIKKITDADGTDYVLDTESGKAMVGAGVRYGRYQLTEAAPQTTVSAIMESAKNGGATTTHIDATGGSLVVDADITGGLSMSGNSKTYVQQFAKIGGSNAETANLELAGGALTLGNGAGLQVTGDIAINGSTILCLEGDNVASGTTLLTCGGNITGDTGLLTLDYKPGFALLFTEKAITLAALFEQGDYDTAVQANWGVFTASHAFVETARAPHTHAGAIADGRGSVWVSAIGSSHSISGSGFGSGSDISLYGGAVGAELYRGAGKHLVGVALGHIRGDVQLDSGYEEVDQEGVYFGLYGEHTLYSNPKFSGELRLAWGAAYGRTESECTVLGNNSDWEQDNVQLNARVDWRRSVSQSITLHAFAGLEYFANDSADLPEGARSGSVQNLRAEVGVGASYTVQRLSVFGEISYLNDVVRHNPRASFYGYAGEGANPGRQGIGVSVGARYDLGKGWSTTGGYSLEAMEHAQQHSVFVGASYSF